MLTIWLLILTDCGIARFIACDSTRVSCYSLVVDGMYILFNRVVLNHFTLHEKSWSWSWEKPRSSFWSRRKIVIEALLNNSVVKPDLCMESINFLYTCTPHLRGYVVSQLRWWVGAYGQRVIRICFTSVGNELRRRRRNPIIRLRTRIVVRA